MAPLGVMGGGGDSVGVGGKGVFLIGVGLPLCGLGGRSPLGGMAGPNEVKGSGTGSSSSSWSSSSL